MARMDDPEDSRGQSIYRISLRRQSKDQTEKIMDILRYLRLKQDGKDMWLLRCNICLVIKQDELILLARDCGALCELIVALGYQPNRKIRNFFTSESWQHYHLLHWQKGEILPFNCSRVRVGGRRNGEPCGDKTTTLEFTLSEVIKLNALFPDEIQRGMASGEETREYVLDKGIGKPRCDRHCGQLQRDEHDQEQAEELTAYVERKAAERLEEKLKKT